MILIGLGGNLPGPLGPAEVTLQAALDGLAATGVRVVARSRWYRTEPVPASDQPWFVNGVAIVTTALDPAALLSRMQAIEVRLGRRPAPRNAARPIDLDLLAYDDRVEAGESGPILPHPRLQERAFVLLPLAEVAPGWRHPRLGLTVEAMIAALPPNQHAEPMAAASRPTCCH